MCPNFAATHHRGVSNILDACDLVQQADICQLSSVWHTVDLLPIPIMMHITLNGGEILFS
jgi:hypothetical protein